MARSRPARSPSGRRTPARGVTVGDLAAAMEAVAPSRLAESWDNVGLLLGDRAASCRKVLVSVDWTPQVLAEALALRADAVVSYHPPIFDALKRLDAADPAQGALLGAARAGIALLSPHTAYDAVQGGMTDWLAEGLAGGAREVARVAALQPLRPACPRPSADRSTSETAPESALRPSPGEGAGRLLELRRDEPLSVIAARLRRFLGAPRVDAVVAGARHRRIAICPGAGASFLPDAVARGATLLVTGEARHHEQLAARAVGVSKLLAGHTWTERGCLPRLARALSAVLAGPSFAVASSDLPPLTDPIARSLTARAARRPARPR